MEAKKHRTYKRHTEKNDSLSVNPLFVQAGEGSSVPRWTMPDGEMLPETAYQIIHDEVFLDGNARQNMATFVTTWMEPQADRLYSEAYDKNMVDKDEYPQTAAIEQRCVNIIADLWHSPEPKTTMGTSTIGSSESCMLAGLAMKRRWKKAREAAGKPATAPNIVFASSVQVVWEKFANYWDVEPRYVPITADKPYLDPALIPDFVDENTIGVVGILGQTYTGTYEPIKDIAAALDDLQAKTGLDVPLHVDAASGGFIAPFTDPGLVWDFAVGPRVISISSSGHKFGLVYPGLGWIVWRTKEDLPEDLIFWVTYLGGDTPTLGLNFSRPGAQVLLQYYNFLRLGREGYERVQHHSLDIARQTAKDIAGMGPFEPFTSAEDMPLITWTLKKGYTKIWDLYDLSNLLRQHGWQVPAYPMPASMEDVVVMRIVFRNDVSADLMSMLTADIERAVAYLDRLEHRLPRKGRTDDSFHH